MTLFGNMESIYHCVAKVKVIFIVKVNFKAKVIFFMSIKFILHFSIFIVRFFLPGLMTAGIHGQKLKQAWNDLLYFL